MTAPPDDAAGRPQDEDRTADESTSDSVGGRPTDSTMEESSFRQAADANATADAHSASPADRTEDLSEDAGATVVAPRPSVTETFESASLPAPSDPERLLATVESAWLDVKSGEADGGTRNDMTLKSLPGGQSTIDERPLNVAERTVVTRGSDLTREMAASHAEYELGPKLGSGGIGVVYEARQTSINRSVALKMLQEEEAASHRSVKFLEEAIITGELDHPNIVPIYDLGRSSDGRLFYAMKQVRGTPWKHVLHTQKMPVRLRTLLRACDAIAFAHSRGVVHRDLKPENIMLGEFGEVLVMDWGLALHRDRHDETNSSLGGTPGFMAPEMVTGPIGKIGPHSDIYLLGAILYQIITGFPPHAGQHQMACLLNAARNKIEPTEDEGELLDIALHAMAKDPQDRHASVKDFQKAVRQYQSHEESLELQESARDAAERARQTRDYNTFSEAVHSYENAIRLWDGNEDAHSGLSATRADYARAACAKGDFDLGLSVLHPEGADFDRLRNQLRVGLVEREARVAHLRRAKIIGLGLVASLLVVMSVSAIWINSEKNIAKANEKTANEQSGLAKQNARKAEANRKEAVENHRQADNNFRLAKQAVDELLTKTAVALEDEPGQHELRQSFLRNAQRLYARLVQDRPDDPQLLHEMGLAWHRFGEINRDLEEFDDATNAFAESIAILNELSTQNPDNTDMRRQLAESHNSLGETRRTLEKTAEAEQQFDLALLLLKKLLEIDAGNREFRVLRGRSLNNLGLVYYQTDRISEAHEAFSQVITDLQKLSLENDTRLELARASLNRGSVNTNMTESAEERLQVAQQDYRRAITLLEELREKAPRKAGYRLDLCRAWLALGNLNVRDRNNRDLEKAEEHILKSVELIDGLVADFDDVTAYRRQRDNTLNSLAAVYYYDRNYDEAAKAWARVRDEAQRLFDEQPEVPENQSQLGRALSNLGLAYSRLGKHEQASEVLVAARDHLRAAAAANSENPTFKRYLRNALRSLAQAYLGTGDHAASRRTTLEVVDLYPEASTELYVQSRKLALCVAVLVKDPDLTDEQRSELRAEYVGQAVDLLEESIRRAVAEGSPKIEKAKLEAQEDYESIRDEPKFQMLLDRIDSL